MLKAIGFDLWETLITNTPELTGEQSRLRLTRMEAILTARGHASAAVRIEHAYRSQWRRCQELYWSADIDVPCRRQIEHFLEALELDPSTFSSDALDELEQAYAHAAVEIPPAMVSGAADLLAELRGRGFSIGLVSNTGRTPGYALRRILGDMGLAPHIDVMVFSNEHGACKPQRSIFEELRRGLGVDYPEMLFVGDNLHADVYGAKRCGMRTVLFMPPRRGTAVAPPVVLNEEVVPDATVRRLDDLLPVVETLRR